MAQRRMMSLRIIDTDQFLDMPMTAQALYMHLCMRADDDGFVDNPRKIRRMTGSSEDDYKLLMGKQFIIPFDSGVCVIKHWRIHNYIQKDRYQATMYQGEINQLQVDDNGVYHMGAECIHDGHSTVDTQVRLGKDRLGKDKEEGKSASKADSQYKTKDGGTLPINTTRYTRLVDEYGESTVNDYIERAHRYSLKKKGDVSYYRDYSSAAEDYMKRDGVAKQTKTVFEPEVEAFFNSENYRRQAKVGEYDPRRQ